MPARTNSFQKLVLTVQRILAPAGAIVRESAIVRDGLDEPREIDVLIENVHGKKHLKIAVEAKDHRRNMSRTEFESLVCKYHCDGGISVDQLVVITHRGFTKSVEKHAAHLRKKGARIDLEILTEVTERSIRSWAVAGPSLFVFRGLPRFHVIRMLPLPAEISLDRLVAEGQLSCPSGCHAADVPTFIQEQLIRGISEAFSGCLKEMFDLSERLRTPIFCRWCAAECQFRWQLGNDSGFIDQISFVICCESQVTVAQTETWSLRSSSGCVKLPVAVTDAQFRALSINVGAANGYCIPQALDIRVLPTNSAEGETLEDQMRTLTFEGVHKFPLSLEACERLPLSRIVGKSPS